MTDPAVPPSSIAAGRTGEVRDRKSHVEPCGGWDGHLTITHWTEHGAKPSRAIGTVTLSNGQAFAVYHFSVAAAVQDALMRGYPVKTWTEGDTLQGLVRAV